MNIMGIDTDTTSALKFIDDNPWYAIGIAFVAGALMGTDIPGRGLVLRAVRTLAWREVGMLVQQRLPTM
jgi:hypothetical protein|nr:hypothetical protein [Kofleriaceae bacterium]